MYFPEIQSTYIPQPVADLGGEGGKGDSMKPPFPIFNIYSVCDYTESA